MIIILLDGGISGNLSKSIMRINIQKTIKGKNNVMKFHSAKTLNISLFSDLFIHFLFRSCCHWVTCRFSTD